MLDWQNRRLLSPVLFQLAPIWILSIAALTLSAAPALAQQRNVDPRIVFDEQRPLSYAGIRMTHFGRGPLDRIFEPTARKLIDLENRGGPEFISYYTLISQQGSQGGRRNWTTNQELDSYAQWRILESSHLGSGKVYAYFYHIKDDFTGTDTQQFATAAGSAWLTNYNDADGQFNALDVLVWEQSWNDGQFEVLVGQMDPGVFFDLNSYAGDDTGYFIAEPLATNPARAYPLAGLGLLASASPVPWLEVFASISDADADGRYPDFKSLEDDRWFYAVEVVVKPEVGGHRGNYRFTSYWIDETNSDPRGRGLSLSLDQQISRSFGLFFRFAQSDGRRPDLRRFVNAGLVCLEPLGWKNDRAGVGIIWGKPTDRAKSSQYGMEVFYRWQLTARLQFSPDLQVIVDPSLTSDRDFVVIGGLRARWVF